jgi:hypothetical protein
MNNQFNLPDSLLEEYAVSQISYPGPALFFLKERFITETCSVLGMDKILTEAFQQAAQAVAADEGLLRVAWHLYLKTRQDKLPVKSEPWPFPNELQLFYALVYLSCVPHVLELNAKRGIDRAITLDTLTDLEIWIRNHHSKKGVFGLTENRWLARHFAGRIFKLGRLQFEKSAFYRDFHVLRNRKTGRFVVLAGNNATFRPDGQFADADQTVFPSPWKATFENSGIVIRGASFSPLGFCENRVKEYPLSEWEVVAELNDPSLAVHIPATGPMDHALCAESFSRAGSFFAAHFPEYRYRAFTCESWLLNLDLEKILLPESNIVRFLKEWYLYPSPGANPQQTYDRVFGDVNIDLSKAPRTTSLQKAVSGFLEKGNKVRNGGGLIFPQGMEWGRQVYRKS